MRYQWAEQTAKVFHEPFENIAEVAQVFQKQAVESVQDGVMGDCVRYQTNLGAEPTQSRWNESCRITLCSRCLVSVR